MTTRRRPPILLLSAVGLSALVVCGGCASSPSPTNVAIERGDSAASTTEQRVAPMANRRRGLMVAGDGFGRMAYASQPTVATASADAD